MDLLRYQRSMDPTNLTDEYDYNYEYTGPAVLSVKDVLYGMKEAMFPVIVSIIGIAFFIFILTKKQLRNNPTCWLVINVLVAVLIQGLVLGPIIVSMMYSSSGWRLGLGGCYIYMFLTNFNCIYIQLSVLLLMIDRFIYFWKQSRHPEIMTDKVVRIAIVSLVVFQALLCIVWVAINTPELREHGHMTSCASLLSNNGWLVQYSLFVMVPICANVLFGLITFVCTLVMCHKLNEGNAAERSQKKQAVALIILVGLFNIVCSFSFYVYILVISTSSLYATSGFFEVMVNLRNMYFWVLPIVIVVLIPEIRSEMYCCRREKKGESTPLI